MYSYQLLCTRGEWSSGTIFAQKNREAKRDMNLSMKEESRKKDWHVVYRLVVIDTAERVYGREWESVCIAVSKEEGPQQGDDGPW